MKGNLTYAHPVCTDTTVTSCRWSRPKRLSCCFTSIYSANSVQSQRMCLVCNWASEWEHTATSRHCGAVISAVLMSKTFSFGKNDLKCVLYDSILQTKWGEQFFVVVDVRDLKYESFISAILRCASHLSAEGWQIFLFFPVLVYFGVTCK